MWNRCSPTNSKKLLIDHHRSGIGSSTFGLVENNVHATTASTNASSSATAKISLAMEIHIQNKCVSAQRITLEAAEPPWFQGPLKAAFLGATGVGKTSVLQQFFKHDFPKRHIGTARRNVYRSCLVCDTCIRELMVFDVPPQKKFPIDNLAEWNNGNPLGLRTVHAYVLVFDMGNLETFQVGVVTFYLFYIPISNPSLFLRSTVGPFVTRFWRVLIIETLV